MPKQKTRKSAAKRYHFTGNGKIRYKQQGMGHILTKKRRKRKRKLRKAGILSAVETKRARSMMPYG